MTTFNGNFTRSISGSSTEDSSVTFGVDVDQSPVYLNVDVIPSYAFARLMLVLGNVVRMQDAGMVQDHSAYQEWVRGEYLKELNDEMKDKEAKLRGLIEKKNEIKDVLKVLKRKSEKYNSKNFIKERDFYFKNWIGSPTPLIKLGNLTKHLGGAQIWAKVVSEANGGAHKIYNATVHALICKAMG